jgi:hypothetical protein
VAPCAFAPAGHHGFESVAGELHRLGGRLRPETERRLDVEEQQAARHERVEEAGEQRVGTTSASHRAIMTPMDSRTNEPNWSRRDVLRAAAAVSALAPWSMLAAGCRGTRDDDGSARERESDSSFRTRGVVLVPDDLSYEAWPERAREAGLTTIALHHGLRPSIVAAFVASERGQRFLATCARLGLAVEYELHAMGELLPRDLFAKDPSLFRATEKGERIGDVNLCVHSRRALEIVAENAVALDAKLRPTTHRRFLWGDDGAPWCRCKECVGLSDSDQALTVENAVVAALRRVDPDAQLAHLAYANTLAPPKSVKPERGVFLEFAPLDLRFHRPLTSLADPGNADVLALLDANLGVFERETAQALEYWLDDSMWSGWRKPARPIRWSDEAVTRDVEVYASRGVRHVTSFAVFVDADYVATFGFPRDVKKYGDLLKRTQG